MKYSLNHVSFDIGSIYSIFAVPGTRAGRPHAVVLFSREAAELRKRIEKYEDKGNGSCYLGQKQIAQIVQEALKHFDGERYRLFTWCIMPNHVHVLMKTKTGYPLEDSIHSWKSFTAHKANKLLKRTDRFWMPGYFDRFMRNQDHLWDTVVYILNNPVRAGLAKAPEDWPWSGSFIN